MSDDQDEQEDETKPDLTRIEDLSEYLHEEDDSTDAFFEEAEKKRRVSEGTSIDSMEEAPPTPDEEPLREDFSGSHDFDANDLDAVPDTPEEEPLHDSFAEEGDAFGDNADEGDTFADSADEGDAFADSGDDFGADTEADPFAEADTETAFASESDSEGDAFGDSEESDFSSEDNAFGDADDAFSSGDDADIDTNEATDPDALTFGEAESEDNTFSDGGDETSFESDSSDEDTSFAMESDESEDAADFNAEDNDTFDAVESESDAFEADENESDAFSTAESESTNTFDEVESEVEVEEQPEPTPTPTPRPARENFEDLRQFGNAISYGTVAVGGNPPFSIIVKEIKYSDDADAIMAILKDHGVVSDDNESDYQRGLNQGAILISQIGEYSAIYLAHKFRRFDVSIQIGLSDEIHTSKAYEKEGRGLVTRYNLNQNVEENVSLEENPMEVDSIILSTTPTLEGYTIHRYLEVLTSHSIVDEAELKRLHAASELAKKDHDDGLDDEDYMPDDEHRRITDSDETLVNYSLGLNEIYRDLSNDLRNQAYKIEANGVIGINYQITPMIGSIDGRPEALYKITCTGNAVWVIGDEQR